MFLDSRRMSSREADWISSLEIDDALQAASKRLSAAGEGLSRLRTSAFAIEQNLLPGETLGSDQIDKFDQVLIAYIAFVESACRLDSTPDQGFMLIGAEFVTLAGRRPHVARTALTIPTQMCPASTEHASPRIVPSPVTDRRRRFTGMGWYWLGNYAVFRQAALYRLESSSSIGDN